MALPNSLAGYARVIYLDSMTGATVAIRSLNVLKPHTVGNKGD